MLLACVTLAKLNFLPSAKLLIFLLGLKMSPENNYLIYFAISLVLVLSLYFVHRKLEKKRLESLEKEQREKHATSK